MRTLKCKTTFQKSVIGAKEARKLYVKLRDEIEWEEGIRSKKGFTRLAKALAPGDCKEVDDAVAKALATLSPNKRYFIRGIYLNYYKDGSCYTPNHKHEGTHQLVISLGASRTLQIGKKDYKMESGDAIVFGSSIHGVPKDDSQKRGRISIATFMVPEENMDVLPAIEEPLPDGDELLDLQQAIIQSLYMK
jgi:hypothetical protein